jgi:hypothetical protein
MSMGPTAAELPTLLLAGAKGDYSEEAAVGLLAEHGMWLQRSGFVCTCISVETAPGGQPLAFVDWHASVRALDAGDLPCSTSEASVLRIAAGIGGVPVDLRVMLGGLDAANILLVAKALMHANGTPVSTLPASFPYASGAQPPSTATDTPQPITHAQEGHRHG